MLNRRKYRRDIQVLRGIAVLAVVLFHAEESRFPLGYLGVDVFFVISGFVVTPLILRIFTDQPRGRHLSSLRQFYRRRFYRLAPALAVTLAISGMLMFFFGPIADHKRISGQGIATLLLLGNVGAYKDSSDYFNPNPNPLLHTWSLSVEEQIYIFLPFILVVILHNHKDFKKSIAVVLAFIGAISFFSFLFPTVLQPLYSRAGVEYASQFSFYSPFERIWQFAVGGITFFLLDQYQNCSRKPPKSVLVFTTFALILFLFGPMHINQKSSSILASFFAVIVILSKCLNVLPDFFVKKLEWVGDRSYSIYLIHMPLFYLATHSPVIQIGGTKNQLIQSAIAVVTSIFLGALSYSKIEMKYRNLGKFDPVRLKTVAGSFLATLFIPLAIFVILDRSAEFGLKNKELPVPSKTLPWDWDKSCRLLFLSSDVKSNPCKYGNHDSGKSILLIGDSHAASISRAIISLGRSNNLDTYIKTFPGCSFVLDKSDFRSQYSYSYLTTDCLQHNKSILDFVKYRKPTVIIYMQRSSSIMIYPNDTKSRTLYNQMVSKNLEVLMKEKIKMIHIGSTPEFLPITTRIQDLLNMKNRFSDIPFEDNSFWERNKVTNYYLNTLDIFCPGKVCRNNSTRGWLFHDSDHLSEIGADRLIPELDPLLQKILSGKY
jgi:peptidoglycan/LPS O-acetylase OafA/YrhL